jgi:signal transduction histidine kinase
MVVEEELARLEESVQRFLDFARPPTPEKQLFDVRVVVQRILDLLCARAARQHVFIQSDLPDAPVDIQADRDQVRQVLLNTLLNSLDAMGEGGQIRIELAAEEAPQERREGQEGTDRRRWVAIKVTDNGPGIPEELGERIFDPFVSTKETGLGLGLAICRRIVEAHGGDMTAANTDSGGAELLIRLPSGTSGKTRARD